MNRNAGIKISLAITLVLGACSYQSNRKENTSQLSDGQPFTLHRNPQSYLNLQTYSTCDALLTKVREQSLARIEESFAEQRHHLISWHSHQDDFVGAPRAGSEEMASDEAADNKSGPDDYTSTNTQIEGVDEADIVKTNGSHIFAISGKSVKIVASWPAETMATIATIAIPGLPQDMFLTEDQKLIVSYIPEAASSALRSEVGIDYPGYDPYDSSRLNLVVYDVSSPATPGQLQNWSFSGQYISMRRIGSSIRLVQTEYIHWSGNLTTWINTWLSNGSLISLAEFDRQVANAIQENLNVINEMSLKDFFGSKDLSDDRIFATDESCGQIYVPELMETMGLTKITSINIDNGEFSQGAVLLPSNLIYGSQSSLYLALSSRWFWTDNNEWESRSFVHRFSLDDPSSVSYLGSGQVAGYLINQFSMDEHEGILRLAVTQEIPDPSISDQDIRWWRPTITHNRVITLATEDGRLEVLGQTEALAEGEQIYSSRFMGDKGYIVTFRQIDPLFTFDLSDPANPQVLGELKIPGYSTYIHLLDDDHLLTVGRDGDDQGVIGGIKISVFDVSDMSNPREKHTFVVEQDSWSWSEAEYNHKAFTFFRSRGLLGLPIGGYRNVSSLPWQEQYFSELLVFHVDAEQGIRAEGAINMSDVYNGQSQPEWWSWYQGTQVRRSVFADEYVYSICDFGIKAVNLSDLDEAVAIARFR